MCLWETMNRSLRLAMLLLLLSLGGNAPVWASTEIIHLRYWAAPEHTRVVIDTSAEIQYTVQKSASKVQLDLENAVLSPSMQREYLPGQPGIKKVTFTPFGAGKVRVELFVAEKVEARIFKLKKFQEKPDRLVVDIVLPDVEKETSQAREQVKIVKKAKIIVVDPGHGGDDPGAIGKRGTTEKSVVLAIGKKLRDVLNEQDGTSAFLTREGDYYVPFKKRLGIARELGADLFISVHADAARNRSANGASVYCLSTGGASSEAAKILAGKENMADIIGGAFGDGNSSDESDPIILNMYQTNTINQSKVFGANVLDNLCRINNLKFPRVQEAPLRVLKFPEIPAVLIETAYISNSQEELNLLDENFQTNIARSIAASVREFFALPKLATPVMAMKSETEGAVVKKRQPPAFYRVKKGDTLSKIAVRQQTEVDVLLRLNKIKRSDPLYVGRKLALPAASGPDGQNDKDASQAEASKKRSPEKAAPLLYRVRKGDTVARIARRHHTQASTILQLNHMKSTDLLYVDRELRLPSPSF